MPSNCVPIKGLPTLCVCRRRQDHVCQWQA